MTRTLRVRANLKIRPYQVLSLTTLKEKIMGGGLSKEIGGEGSLSVKDNEEDGRISKLQEQLSFVMPAKCIYVGGVQRYREGI